MPIQHLVISGGGPSGLVVYGSASHLAKKGFWSLSNIKSIYGCSIGAYFGAVFSLGYEWDWLDDYFIKRPWDKVIANSTVHLMDIYNQRGLINENFFIESIKPLLSAKDLSIDITMEELYEFNQIELHIYTVNINSNCLEKVDVSYKTYPKLSLVKALQMSMSFPVIFHPVCLEETQSCFIDGGLLNNYPLNDCLEQQQCEHDAILAFKNKWSTDNVIINEKSTIVDFLLIVFKKMIYTLDTEGKQVNVKNTILCDMSGLDNFDKWIETLSSEELRLKTIEMGYAAALDFIGSC